MSEEIKTANIFLDTSVFVRENFFSGIKLNSYLKHQREQKIQLYITDITINECISNIEKRFRESKNLLKKSIKDLSTKGKILKNVKSLESLFLIEEKFESEKELEQLKIEFRTLINKHFKIIKIDNDKLEKIITDYFEENPPFKSGSKKHEFPDAIVLNSIESWCGNNKNHLYVLSEDPDLLSYESKYLIITNEYDKILDQISHTFSEKNIINKVEESITNYERDIIDTISEEFENDFPMEGWDDTYGFEFSVQRVNVENIYIINHFILSIYDNKASVELTIGINYDFEVDYQDVNTAFYDKEDDAYYGVKTLSQNINEFAELKVEINVNVNLPGKPAIWDWEFESIIKGVPENISLKEDVV